ncbi:MAG TPA: hypothetical protein PLU71_03720 [Candidatus Dependentiae bacterium]|nr:hypothetical protein [Candidatus Dependentiae bacterium]HRQ62940.1 hypothetical protein [Candidatus Dependentiae bacterium]
MKGLLRIRYVVCLVIFTICGTGIKKGISMLYAQQQLACICDQRIAPIEQKKIINALHTLFKQNELSMHTLTLDIQERFPFIKSCTLSYMPGVTCCSLKVRNPFCLINDVLVLTDDGVLVIKDVFKEPIIATLKTAIVDRVAIQKEHAIWGFQECIAALPATILNIYDVIWHDRLHAQLRDKKEKRFSILFDVDSLPDEELFRQCERIKDDLVAKDVFQQSRRSWVADVRFTKQIIVFEDKGGLWYG